MPIYQYTCPSHGLQERFFPTFGQAEPHIDSTLCGWNPTGKYPCRKVIPRTPEVPLQAHLLGSPDGYHRPSPTKRFSTKLAAQSGNANSAG